MIYIDGDMIKADSHSSSFVQTDMGNAGARIVFGQEKASIGVDESCDGVVQVIDAATKESHGARFWDNDGKNLSW